MLDSVDIVTVDSGVVSEYVILNRFNSQKLKSLSLFSHNSTTLSWKLNETNDLTPFTNLEFNDNM